MKINNLLIITHCFPLSSHEIPGNFLYDFCFYLKKNNPELKITLLTPKYCASIPDKKYLGKVLNRFLTIEWKGSKDKRRLAEYSFKKPGDLSKIFSLLRNGKKALKDLLLLESFDHILACWLVPSAFLAYKICKKSKIPFSVWSLGSDINIYTDKFIFKSLQKAILRNADFSFVNNYKFIRKLYNSTGVISRMLPTNRIICDDLEPLKKYTEQKTLRYVFIGRLEEVKGPDLLLESFFQVKSANWELLIIGDGSLRPKLEKIVFEKKLEGKIRFYGSQGKEFIKRMLLTSDYLVISSRSEGMPVVFWEAMQCGVPVLSTPVGDIPHFVNKYNVGRITDDICKDSLSKLISFSTEFQPLHYLLQSKTKELAKLVSIKKSADDFISLISFE